MMLAQGLSLLGRVLGRGKLSILIYHQVLADPDPMRPSEPTAEVFDWQMALLARHFTPLSLDQALAGLKNDSLPANAACVTFDDGYRNNLTIAQPILQKYAIPATVYVATAFSEGSNMWNDRIIYLFADPQRTQVQLEGLITELGDWSRRRQLAGEWLQKLKYLPIQKRLDKVASLYEENGLAEQPPMMMAPAEVKELSDKGITIGAHTVNHPILKVLSSEEQLGEIRNSKASLEAWTGRAVEHFAYPNGVLGRDLDEQTVEYVRQAGFQSAVVTDWGTSDAGTSPWLLPRFTPWDKAAMRFHVRLTRNQLGL